MKAWIFAPRRLAIVKIDLASKRLNDELTWRLDGSFTTELGKISSPDSLSLVRYRNSSRSIVGQIDLRVLVTLVAYMRF